MPFHKILRGFTGAGLDRVAGEAVQPDEWRNGQRLIEQRMIERKPLASEPTACPCGRLWADEVREHDCPGPKKPEKVTGKAGASGEKG